MVAGDNFSFGLPLGDLAEIAAGNGAPFYERFPRSAADRNKVAW